MQLGRVPVAVIHAHGDLLGLYCSGTAWTQKNFFTGYSREDEFEKQGLRDMVGTNLWDEAKKPEKTQSKGYTPHL